MCDPAKTKNQKIKIIADDAVGTVLAHDITRIIPGKFKGVAFKKGHIIQKNDIPELLKIGKRSVFILEISESELHEDDAALRIAPAIVGDNLKWTDPCEGKSRIVGKCDGLLKVNVNGLTEINKIDDIIVSTLKTEMICKKDQTIAATRIIPLTISRKDIERLEMLAEKYKPILEIKPFKKLRFGAVITG